MKIKTKIHGVDKTIQHLKQRAKLVVVGTEQGLQEATQIGWQISQTFAPEYTGALKREIIYFEKNKESWIIQSSPSPSDFGFPLNIAFEKGDFSKMTMWGPGKKRIPFRPRRASSIGFMTQTVEQLRKLFPSIMVKYIFPKRLKR